MKKVLFLFIAVMSLSLGINVMAYENIDYTLENGVLTVNGTAGFEGDLQLPTPSMGEVDKIIFKKEAGHVKISSLKLTAKSEIEIEKSTFHGLLSIKEVTLSAPDKIKIGGEGWDWDDRFDYGCFESSGVEKVILNTNHLDLSEGWAFHNASMLNEFECSATTSDVGVECFDINQPWIQNYEDDFVLVGDTYVCYSGSDTEITLPVGKMVVDLISGNENIKSVIMPDELTEIPQMEDFYSFFSFMENLEKVKLSENLTAIPTLCFVGCTNLKEIRIPESVRIIYPCFSYCESLEELIIPRNTYLLDSNFGSITMFNECENLVLKVYEGSYGEEYVKNPIDDIKYEIIPKVSFWDKEIETAVQVRLGIIGDLYETDLEKVTELELRGVTTLEDVKKLTNLESLTATFGWIDDVSPLTELTKLEKLNLSFNRLQDIAPLGEIESLNEVNVMGNLIRDISPIEHIENLEASKNLLNDITSWIEIGEKRAEIRVLDLGGMWYYGMYCDGELKKAQRINVSGKYRNHYASVTYPEGVNPSDVTVKLFLWKDESMQPYEVLGYWELPVIKQNGIFSEKNGQ